MNAHDLPDTLFDFALIPKWDDRLHELAALIEPEDWEYHKTPSLRPFPILSNYLRYTYIRLAEEHKIVVSSDEKWACFNSGLVTPNQEPVYLLFEENLFSDRT